MTDIELKPCPFCGENKAYINLANWRMTCQSCGGCGPIGGTANEAAAAWNKRAESGLWFATYSCDFAREAELEAENKRLKDERKPMIAVLLNNGNFWMPESSADAVIAEINQLEDYAADLRIIIRKARKVLKDVDTFCEVKEARKLLKEGLKTK
jgi:Lar family restriction alleviation protein